MLGLSLPILGIKARPASGPSGDPYWANVVLLSGFEGTDGSTTLIDESEVGRALTAQSTAQIDTAQFKFGASSLLLNGTSDYVTAADSTDFEFALGEFTIECFVRLTSTPNDFTIMSHRDGAANGWRVGRFGASLEFVATGAGTGTQGWSPSTGVWYHIAVDRDATLATRIYLDGVMHNKGTGTGSITASTDVFAIGRNPASATFYFPGHIDEVRITKGIARYASDSGFTVPASAYPRG